MWSNSLKSSRAAIVLLVFWVALSSFTALSLQSQLYYTDWRSDQIVMDTILFDTTYQINQVKEDWNSYAPWVDSVLGWNYSTELYDSVHAPAIQRRIDAVKALNSQGYMGIRFEQDSFYLRSDTNHRKGTFNIVGQNLVLDFTDTLLQDFPFHITYLTSNSFIVKRFQDPTDTLDNVLEIRFVRTALNGGGN
jgi:hypothetical protein